MAKQINGELKNIIADMFSRVVFTLKWIYSLLYRLPEVYTPVPAMCVLQRRADRQISGERKVSEQDVTAIRATSPNTDEVYEKDYVMSSQGGFIGEPGQNTSLEVPPGAILDDSDCVITRVYHPGHNNKNLYIHGQKAVTPVVEFKTTKRFRKHVKLTFINGKEYNSKTISVYYRQDPSDNWKQILVYPNSDNIINQTHLPDIYFTHSHNMTVIHTTHFTQFVCTCSSTPRQLVLEAVAYAMFYRGKKDQEYQLNVYIKDKSSPRKNGKGTLREGEMVRDSMALDMPTEIGLKWSDKVGCKLSIGEPSWSCSRTEEIKSLERIVGCHGGSKTNSFAEFVLTSPNDVHDSVRVKLTFSIISGEYTKITKHSFRITASDFQNVEGSVRTYGFPSIGNVSMLQDGAVSSIPKSSSQQETKKKGFRRKFLSIFK